ncbi:hypothetical protein KFK14_14935 [Sphingobium phenoxybenzoativorans]|uniref:Uncharacterized protein n=1 Tax=Sphingobium phenoxybenzoativorans TaxID=1592790 RepID=A0A975K3U6_9SPHN|nr:hypothetical protein [Sphingobium phenoxybenzoativorans]QUT04358.1 hypothetical protein KFK14_14935 [Sphingobium phenoxybenzoativorans]
MLGDSHTNAVFRAFSSKEQKLKIKYMKIYRISKIKNGKKFGDIEFSSALRKIRRLKSKDYVFSMVGGNQYAIFSTIQHPVPFDFFYGGSSIIEHDRDVELIPERVIRTHLTSGVHGRDGVTLQALRKATSAQLYHILPPPPKIDSDYILNNHETHFSNAEIGSLGVSPPALRLRTWQMQNEILSTLCNKLGIGIMVPPAQSCTGEGFLRTEYYANDATHANRRYGDLILRQIEDIVS